MESCQTSPSKRENWNFGIVIRFFVSYFFAGYSTPAIKQLNFEQHSICFVWFVESCHISPSKRENRSFAIILRILVCYIFANYGANTYLLLSMNIKVVQDDLEANHVYDGKLHASCLTIRHIFAFKSCTVQFVDLCRFPSPGWGPMCFNWRTMPFRPRLR